MSTEMQETGFERWLLAMGPAKARAMSGGLISAVIAGVAVSVPRGFGSNLVSATQITVTLLFLASIPILVRNPLKLQSILSQLCAGLLVVLAFLPSLYYLVDELFFGHARMEDAQWYNALWRIYGILGVWILFAVLNEAKIRPYLRLRDKLRREAGSTIRPNTVASRADTMRREKRDEKLKELAAQIRKTKGRRDEAKEALDTFEETASAAVKSVESAEKLLKEAENRAKAGSKKDKEAAREELETVKSLADGARAHQKGLKAQLTAHKMVYLESVDRVQDLDEKWKYWSNLENYPFYR